MGESETLNGAYYGPPIPPRRSYPRPGGRSPDCCCCGGLCVCLLSVLCKLVLSAAVLAGAVILVVWLALRPIRVNVHVDAASLAVFNLSGATTVSFNLSLAVSVRNPNNRIGIYYDKVEARAFYKGQRLGSVELPPFYQSRKNTTVLYPVFSGQQFLVLAASDRSDYEHQKRQGAFPVDVKVYARIRLRVWRLKSNHYSPEADCGMTIPLASFGVAFSRTKCDIGF